MKRAASRPKQHPVKYRRTPKTPYADQTKLQVTSHLIIYLRDPTFQHFLDYPTCELDGLRYVSQCIGVGLHLVDVCGKFLGELTHCRI
jgi:hypothetical protein